MKNNRYFFAAVLAVSLSACASDVTGPQLRAPDAPAAFAAAADTTPLPPAPSPAEDPGGMIGSGMGK